MDDFQLLERRILFAMGRYTELEEAVRGFIATGPVGAAEEHEDVGDTRHIRWRVDRIDDPDPALGLLLGEVVHQLRATLDNLWCAFYRKATGKQSCDGTFPVCAALTDWQNNARFQKIISKLPTDFTDVVKDMQPYQLAAHEDSPLWLLNRLWNDDKHRQLLPAVTGIAGPAAITVSGRAAEKPVRTPNKPPPYVVGDVLAELLVKAPADVMTRLDLDYEVVFPAGHKVAGLQVQMVVHDLGTWLNEDVMPRFKAIW